jgi:hypothetical protein
MKRSFSSSIGTLAATLTLLTACSSAIDLAGTTTVYCSSAGSPATSCTTITGPSAGEGTMDSNCTTNGGKLVGSCPTSGVVGCCIVRQDGVTTETCSYTGKASDVEGQCPGTFMKGP